MEKQRDFRGEVRRFPDYGERLYKVVWQSNLSDAIPGDPMDATVVFKRIGRTPPKEFPLHLSFPIGFALSISEEFIAPVVAGVGGAGQAIEDEDIEVKL